MFKSRFNFVLFTFLMNFLNAENLECDVVKSKNKCLCKTFTEEQSSLPIYEADCSGLRIETFPNISKLSADINALDLSLNDIKSLDLQQNINTDDGRSLTKLVLRHNKIENIADSFFESFENLVSLHLSYNNITSLHNADLFKKLKNLQYLDLRFNGIKTLPSGIFEPLEQLTYLDLSNNPLGSFLTLSKDVLSRTLHINQNVTHLGLNNVGLEDLNADYFDHLKQLKFLDIADNNFQLIPTVPYSVEHLDLSGNNLTFVSPKYLNYHSLKYLKLSRMPSLVSIHHYAFYNLPSIDTLMITDCPNLTQFTELAFGIASKTTQGFPKHLSLARNGLRHLNSSYQYLFRKMYHIDLRDNPWNCECDILWIKEFENELFGNIRCATPRNLKNKSVMELNHSDMQHCFPEIYGKTSHRVLIVILMATVIVLIGFIFYLVRYPQTWLNPKQFGMIGPNSPYSPAPVVEER